MDTAIIQPGLVFSARDLSGYIRQVALDDICRVPGYLLERTRLAMLEELETIALTPAETVTGPFKVRQSYDYATQFPANGTFLAVKEAIEAQLNSTCERKLPGYLSYPLHFCDTVVQRYTPGEGGISPHRDGMKYMYLVVLFVLEGEGRFCLCDDRDGTNPKEIENEPGDMLLMRAPGFNGENTQPFHFLDRITSQRTSFALRHPRI